MATAKAEGGLYFDSVRKVIVDANGAEVKGAAKPGPDTPPDQQPGALGALTPEQNLAKAITDALGGKATAKAAPAAAEDAPKKSGAKK